MIQLRPFSADNGTMKRLFSISLLYTAAAAGGTVDCVSGWQWLSFAGIPELSNNGDQAIIAGCEWRAPLPPGRRNWPPGLPSLSYTRALPTTVSDSEGFIRYEHWQADIPLLRAGSLVFGLAASGDYRQQLHSLQRTVSYQGTTLSSTQQLLLDRRQTQYSGWIDVRELDSPFSAVRLTYSTERRPLSVTNGTAQQLEQTDFKGWRIALERDILPEGFSSTGHLALGEGNLQGAERSAAVNSLADDQFLLLNLQLGVQWVYRTGPLLLLTRAGAGVTHYQLTASSPDDVVKSDSFTDLDYQLSAGLGLRF